MRTTVVKPSAPQWLLIDAEGKSLGRLSARVATILMGKHKPVFTKHQIQGDHVVIVNASKLSFESAKLHRKKYSWHTGYTGGLKNATLGELFARTPVKVVEKAVAGMLPKNRLRKQMLKRLHVFADAEHTYEAQKPEELTTNN